MKMRDMLPFRSTLQSLIFLGVCVRFGQGLNIAYCSTQNTAAQGTDQYNIYNSNGACQTHCAAQYAFAIVQYQTCWCSNYIPADTASVDECNQHCPGYPQDTCGNTALGLYGYIALSLPASGTQGVSSPSPSLIQPAPPAPATSSPTTSSSTTSVPTTSAPPPPPPSTVHVSEIVSVTVPVTPIPETSVEVSVVTRVPAARISVSTEISSVIPSPVVSVLVVTSSGAPVTETVTSTPLVVPNSSPETVEVQRRTGLSPGAVAGAVLGVLFGVAALVAAGFLLWRRRQAQNDGSVGGAAAGEGRKGNPRRNISVLSKTGLLARARPSMGERDHDEHFYIPPLAGTSSLRHSMLLGLANDGVDPSSPLSGSQDGEGRRSSKPFIYDQRLNPSALYANHDNGSRVSMQDNNDYSRPLGVANPDTRPSFESRLSR